MKLESSYTPLRKINSKWIKGQHVSKTPNHKLLENAWQKRFDFDTVLDNDFFGYDTKV